MPSSLGNGRKAIRWRIQRLSPCAGLIFQNSLRHAHWLGSHFTFSSQFELWKLVSSRTATGRKHLTALSLQRQPRVSLTLFISVLFINVRTVMDRASLLLLSSSYPPQHPAHRVRQKLSSARACLRWAFTSSLSNLFLHSGKAPVLLSACQAPSGGWQAGCQQRPSRPVKGTRVSHFPWSRWRCQPDISLTRHP